MFRKKIPKDTYEIFQGSDWPSYEDYCRGIKSSKLQIQQEIIDLEKDTFSQTLKFKYNLVQLLFQHRVISFALIPGILGLILFLVTSDNYWGIIPICLFFYIINYFYNVGVHRWLSHGQFQPKTWFKYFLLYCTVAVGGFKPDIWTKAHIAHHKFTDTDRDPYSPNRGFWRLFFCYNGGLKDEIQLPKVFEDPSVKFVVKYHTQLHIINLILFLIINANLFLLSFLFLKFYAYVLGGLVNYLFHVHEGKITPTNLPWYLELLFVGECLHKNHHDKPWKFNYGDETRLDYSYQLIKVLSK